MSAAYIGGVSAAGGVGKVTSSLIGAILFMSLSSGMNLLGTDIALQYIIKGAVLLIAVIFDVQTRRSRG
jgi:putative multiple sugar transport system permease protein